MLDRVLHERVVRDDEVAGEPGAEEHHEASGEAAAWPELLLAEEEQAEER